MSKWDYEHIETMKAERVERFDQIRASIKRSAVAQQGAFTTEEIISYLKCKRGTARQVLDDMVEDSELIKTVTAKGHNIYRLNGGANYWLQRLWR